MEDKSAGKLKILKGDNIVYVSENFNFSSETPNIWEFVDNLISKGYNVISVQHFAMKFVYVVLKKDK
tara:strand:+ start:467 stop:667 length:201 start_codon:yes stop_codon:yes gene_type:complete